MALVTSDLSVDESDEPFDSDQALTHLRVGSGQHASEVMRLVAAAREAVERETQRTLRVDVTRVLTMDGWPSSGFRLPWAPLRSITSIQYYDTAGTQQTLASSNYRTELSTEGKGRLHWDFDADLPSLDTRSDAVTITFVTGYAAKADIPRAAIHAIKAKLTELWADGSESDLRAAAMASRHLAGLVDISGYT